MGQSPNRSVPHEGAFDPRGGCAGRCLRAHTATSTLTILAHEPIPIVGDAGRSVMGEAFKQAWRNFVTFLAVLLQALGVIVPLGALGMLAWLASRTPLLRRLRRGTALE